MVFVGGADKAVVGCVHQIPDALNLSGYLVHIFLRSDSGSLCLLLNLLAVLVGSCLEVDVISFCFFIPCNRIRQNNLIGVADMRLAGCVCDCGCHIVFALVAHCMYILSFSCRDSMKKSLYLVTV